MSCVSVLRKLGLLPPRKITDDDVASASTENALRDNKSAFDEMHQAYSKVPDSNNKLRETIRKSTTPFADLEHLMHGDMKRARH